MGRAWARTRAEQTTAGSSAATHTSGAAPCGDRRRGGEDEEDDENLGFMFGAGGGVDTAVRELQEEVDDLTKALEQAKEHEQMALDRQRRELTGTAEEKMAAREARLREQRVEEWNCRALRRSARLACWSLRRPTE